VTNALAPGEGAAAAPAAAAQRNTVLALLLAVYVLNFVDRQILGILVEPIKADLQLTDAQLGLLGGFAFALFYSVLGIPIAWAADRFDRRWIITGALVLWSAMTALCGAAQTYAQLLAARVLVGVGEAGGGPPSQSMIADYFPAWQRPRALGIWALGIPIGSALGVLLGAFVAVNYGWRWAFFAAGAPGVLLAVVFAWVVKEPPRGRFDPPVRGAAPAIWATLRYLTGQPSFVLATLGASLASAAGYSLFFWGAAYFIRRFGLDLQTVSYFSAFVIGVAASAGSFLGGALVSRHGAKDARLLVVIPAVALAAAAPLNALVLHAPGALLAAVLALPPTLLGAMWYGPLFGVVQNLVEPRMRAMATAVMLLVVNLIGLGGGPTLAGQLSTHFAAAHGPAEGLRLALLSFLAAQLLAALVMGAAALTIRADLAKREA
jgi:predicted MFS family arabinose efflux permease